MQKLLLIFVRSYRFLAGVFPGVHCRYYPTCSRYAETAIIKHGALKGSAMAAARILRCHPWHEGGYDPVPEPGHASPGHSCSNHAGHEGCHHGS